MRPMILWLIVIGTLAVASARVIAAPNTPLPARVTTSFDADWRFLKAGAPGAEQPGFDDAAWRTVSVPHDWSIEGPFDKNNPTSGAGAFLPAGIGWYRRRFTLPAADARRRVFVDFDGVMAHSDVWINGFHLSKRPNGYVGFRDELTGHLHFGPKAANVLAVRADNAAQPASRWYAGAGIYRHVRLIVTDSVHLAHWGIFVTTPHVASDRAVVVVQSAVVNQFAAARPIALQMTVMGPDGRPIQSALTAPQTIAHGGTAQFQQNITVPAPQLWNLDHPALYHVRVQVRSGSATLDEEAIPFGIREFHFDPATGFWLNGRNLKIKGVCLHADAGGLGVAVPLGVWERRLTALKAVGCNAIRTSHNPVAPEFLDLCDRMGFLVMDEFFDCWTVGKTPYDYHLDFTQWAQTDARDMVMRDRNHPSIILYSAGNEIHDTPNAPLAKQILASLLSVYHQADPTRPVTQALFRPNASHDYDDGLADMLDVIGTNYRDQELLAAHAAKPPRRIIGTENGHDRRAWLFVRDNPPYAGQFLWTGIDYLGEARTWPTIGSGAGLFDRTNAPRPLAFQRQSWWSETPMVRIARRVTPTADTPLDPGFAPLERRPGVFADWTPRSLTPHTETVEVYSNCAQVELLLNGHSLGMQPMPADDAPRTWRVPFEPGVLRAVARNGGRTVATDELRTAGKPAKIVLSADQHTLVPAWDDVSYVTAVITDGDGIPVPTSDAPIAFQITGPGVLAAVDNGDLTSHEPFQASLRYAFQGRCIAILKATAPVGHITMTAASPGLASASVTILAAPAH